MDLDLEVFQCQDWRIAMKEALPQAAERFLGALDNSARQRVCDVVARIAEGYDGQPGSAGLEMAIFDSVVVEFVNRSSLVDFNAGLDATDAFMGILVHPTQTAKSFSLGLRNYWRYERPRMQRANAEALFRNNQSEAEQAARLDRELRSYLPRESFWYQVHADVAMLGSEFYAMQSRRLDSSEGWQSSPEYAEIEKTNRAEGWGGPDGEVLKYFVAVADTVPRRAVSLVPRELDENTFNRLVRSNAKGSLEKAKQLLARIYTCVPTTGRRLELLMEGRICYWMAAAMNKVREAATENCTPAFIEAHPGPSPDSSAQFPNRATWVLAQKAGQNLNNNQIREAGGPDPSTIKKIESGLFVREQQVIKLAKALKVSRSDIPND